MRGFDQAKWALDVDVHPHEAHYLKLDIQRAETLLNWHPTLNITQAITLTREWYQALQDHQNMVQFTLAQINYFSHLK